MMKKMISALLLSSSIACGGAGTSKTEPSRVCHTSAADYSEGDLPPVQDSGPEQTTWSISFDDVTDGGSCSCTVTSSTAFFRGAGGFVTNVMPGTCDSPY